MSINTDIDISAEKHGGDFQSQQASRRNLKEGRGSQESAGKNGRRPTAIEEGADFRPGVRVRRLKMSEKFTISSASPSPFSEKPKSTTRLFSFSRSDAPLT